MMTMMMMSCINVSAANHCESKDFEISSPFYNKDSSSIKCVKGRTLALSFGFIIWLFPDGQRNHDFCCCWSYLLCDNIVTHADVYICSISANKICMGILRVWKFFCIKTVFHPHHNPFSVTHLLSSHYQVLDISMKICNITTLWFQEQLWHLNKIYTWHAILVKIIFQKQHYEKVRPKRTCCSLSHWHRVMSAYPAVGSGI